MIYLSNDEKAPRSLKDRNSTVLDSSLPEDFKARGIGLDVSRREASASTFSALALILVCALRRE